jgi:hypothetical protein
LKSPTAADAHRIKALVSIAGIKPSGELFWPLAGGREKFEVIVSPSATDGDDLVVSAERVKREFEAAARKEEDRAEHAEGRARGAREAAAGVDTSAECDPTALQTELESSIRLETDLKARAAAHEKAALSARQAQDQLEDAESTYSGPTIEAAKTAEADAKTASEAAQQAVRDAEATLDRARQSFDAARQAYSRAISATKQAEQHESMVSQWREQIAKSIPDAPDTGALADAAKRVATARQTVEQGAIIRKAREHIAEAEKHAETGTKHRQQAMALREAAKGIDTVLSEAVAKTGSPLKVEAGRLYVDSRGEKKLFAELSDGERWLLALDIAIDALGDKGFIGIPQWAWGELQPANKKAIAKRLRDRGVCGYAIQATDDEEFNAEVYTDN